MQKPVTTTAIMEKKNKDKITMITAYDALFARLFDGQVDMILVGDSLAMSFFGAADTLGVTLNQMIYHTKAVCNATSQSLVVCDLPFGTTSSPKQALKAASKIYKQTQAKAVKLEGGIEVREHVELLVSHGIAVVGHIGLKPQFVRAQGGYKIQGKDAKSHQALLKDALALEQAGVFCCVLEGVRCEVARDIASRLSVPVIGIGSGVWVDGQVLVWSDAFGFFESFMPKFVRQYLKGASLIKEGISQYAQDVKSKNFPNADESY